jgi:ribosomal protein S18 acetylase RimI-like enzyme
MRAIPGGFVLTVGSVGGFTSESAAALPARGVRLTEMPWETALLGRRIGRIEGVDDIGDVAGGVAAIRHVEQEATRAGFSVITARVAMDHFAAVWALEESGFLTGDVGVTFEYDLAKSGVSGPRSVPCASTLTLRAANDDDVAALQDMVNGLFRNSYYYVSPHFSRVEADLLHRTWIANCVRHGRADRVLLAEIAGEIVGFITCRCLAAKAGVIELVGVSPGHASRGIGKTLVRAALACFSELDATTVRVRTQATNVAAANVYAATGARLVTVDATLIKSPAAQRVSAD